MKGLRARLGSLFLSLSLFLACRRTHLFPVKEYAAKSEELIENRLNLN